MEKNARIELRVSQEFKDKLEQLAKSEKMSTAEYVRSLVELAQKPTDKTVRRLQTEINRMSDKERQYVYNFVLLMKDIRKG